MRRSIAPALLLFTLGACGGSSSTPDAPGGNGADAGIDATPADAGGPFDCLGKPLPTTAPANVTISGTTEQVTLGGAQPLPSTMVAAYPNAGGAPIATATSDATTGNYSLSAPTGGTPLDGYVLGRHAASGSTTYLDTYLYPPHPLTADQTQGVILMLTSGSNGTLSALSGLAGVTQDENKGVIGLIVADCNGMPLAGAMVTSEPMGTVKYDSGSLPSGDATATAADGRAYIFNVTPGTVNVRATINGMTLRAHDVNARAHAVTTTVIQP